jgi:hypothetical protein
MNKDEIEVKVDEDDADTLVRKADEVRGRLMNTLEAIDQRRQDLTHPAAILRAHKREALILAGALTTVVGGVTAVAVWRARTRESRLRRERLFAARRFWKHPDRIAAERPRSFLGELGRRIAMGTLGMIAMQLVKRLVNRGLEHHGEARAELEVPKAPRLTRKSMRPPDVHAFEVKTTS